MRARRDEFARGALVEFIDHDGSEWCKATVAEVHRASTLSSSSRGGGGEDATYDIQVDHGDGSELQEICSVPRLHLRATPPSAESGSGNRSGSRSRRGSRSSDRSRRGSRGSEGGSSGGASSHNDLVVGMRVRARHPGNKSSEKTDCTIVYANDEGGTYNVEFPDRTTALFVGERDVKIPARASTNLAERDECEVRRFIETALPPPRAPPRSRSLSHPRGKSVVHAVTHTHVSPPLRSSHRSASPPHAGMG